MFELNEAVRSRLIGPKSWDRIVIIFGAIFTVHGLCAWTVWAVCVMIYALNHVVMCVRRDRPRNTGSPSEPIICALKGIVIEGFKVPETVFTK